MAEKSKIGEFVDWRGLVSPEHNKYKENHTQTHNETTEKGKDRITEIGKRTHLLSGEQ